MDFEILQNVLIVIILRFGEGSSIYGFSRVPWTLDFDG